MSNHNEPVRDALLRLSDRLDSSTTLDAVGDWLIKHTTLEGRPWSFKDHEFQLDIVNCTARHAVIQKPTQVGMTELSLRIALALCAMKQYFGLIYTFPSAQFAREQTKTRVDPIIEGSKRLSDLIVKGSDGSEMKRIGTSTFFMGGAATKRQAISRPVKALFFDEKDFSNQTVLSSYHGRLRHVHEEDQIIREFSTPTVAGYGINADLMKSTKQRYMVKCERCNHWQAPVFQTQITIPGWDNDDFTYFTKDDLMNPKVNTDAAYLRCSNCGKDLENSIRNIQRREWVAEHPGRSLIGFEVKPYDLPLYNKIPKLVQDYGLYADETDYWNFVQGEVYASENNQINADVMLNQFTSDTDTRPLGLCIGVDVGARYVYAVAGYRGVENGVTRTRVVWRRRLDIKDGPFIDQMTNVVKELAPECGVMDIAPDFSLSGAFMKMSDTGLYAGRYSSDDKGTVEYLKLNEDSGVVNIQRTKGFNSLVKEMNLGAWEFAPGDDKLTVISHLGGMKRISAQTEEGEMRQTWVKIESQEDHYLHACMYLKAALDLAGAVTTKSVIGVLPMPRGVSLRDAA